MTLHTALIAFVSLAGPALVAADQTPSPALLVLNKEEATLAIVDPGSKKVVARIPVGESPHEIDVSADGKMAFVTNYGSKTPGSTLSVIDLAAQKELRRVSLGSLRKPHGICVADGKVYFTAENNRVIGRYDPVGNQVDWVFGTGQNGTHMVLVNKAADRMFTTNMGSNSITSLTRSSGPTGWDEAVIPVGQGPEALDLSPDGKELWTAHSRDGGVSVIDLATNKVVHTIDLKTKRSNRLKFTPDGKMVLVSDLSGGELVFVDRAGKKEIKRLALGKSPEGILILKDSSRAYVATAGDNSVAVIDLKKLDVVDRISTGTGPDGLAWAER